MADAPLDIMGNAGPVAQGEGKHWDMNTGETQTREFIGTPEKMTTLYNTLKTVAGNNPNIDSIDYKQTKARAVVTVKVMNASIDSSGNTPLIPTDNAPVYEMHANDIYKPVEAAKYYAEDAAVLTAAEIGAVNDALAKGQFFVNPAWNVKQQNLFTHKIQGTTECYVSAYVLRKTINAGRRSQLKASYTGVNTAYTVAQLQAECPEATVGTLIQTIPTGEWLKKTPVVRCVGKMRWQIVQEYWWATKWSLVLYGGTGTP